jgi:very-short-patch-repair endonuclease
MLAEEKDVKISNNNSTKCRLCGKELSCINDLHLRTHNITTEQYRKMFPDAILVSEQFKRNVSNVSKNWWIMNRDKMVGRKLSEETKHRMSLAQRGRKHSEETKRKISEALKRSSKKLSEKMIKLHRENTNFHRKCVEPLIKYSKSDENRISVSNRFKGDNNPAKRDDVRQKISMSLKEIEKTPEWRMKISNALKGRTIPIEQRIKIAETMKNRWKDPAYREKIYKIDNSPKRREILSIKAKERLKDDNYKNRLCEKIMKACKIKPTKAELRLSNILNEVCPNEYKYVGDGQTFIGGRVPDFINFDKKKIIELFGDYWHKQEDVTLRQQHFARYGYSVLVIWEHELKDAESLKNKILSFTYPNYNSELRVEV